MDKNQKYGIMREVRVAREWAAHRQSIAPFGCTAARRGFLLVR